MLFCIVTFNLWLHYNKLLTYLLIFLGLRLVGLGVSDRVRLVIIAHRIVIPINCCVCII